MRQARGRDALRSLSFLEGVWASDDAGQARQVTERF
jgi:hypothetical protein